MHDVDVGSEHVDGNRNCRAVTRRWPLKQRAADDDDASEACHGVAVAEIAVAFAEAYKLRCGSRATLLPASLFSLSQITLF